MTNTEDTAPQFSDYPYSWDPGCGVTLDDFLKKRPSMVEDDGTKPWIWVKGSDPLREDANIDAALEEAADLLKEVSARVEEIKNDPSIPVRSNKKTGARSKKEIREEAQSEATTKLREIALRNGYLTGKWLVFTTPDKVDAIWNRLAHSLVSGPLSQTSAFHAKVSTTPRSPGPNYQHVICVYLPNVFDKDDVTKTGALLNPSCLQVMKVLLRNHGLNLSGAKSDLYTGIHLDSKHASGIPSTVWKNASLLKEDEIKQLKDEFFSSLEAEKHKKDDAKGKVGDGKEDEKAESTSKPKPKPRLQLKKKKVDDDPFASDDEEEEPKGETSKRPLKATSKPPSKVGGKPPSKAGNTAKKPPSKARTTVKRTREESESGEDEKPKRRAPLKSKE
ncbi:hypothetical protein BJ322DRAFT_1102259 [Thelephora terrestris]|uniref:Uncharacterized protein n=1 Tax=Thelephora terrestris TaxID=56493 RepID=A0A9P6L0W6_9AGAM|nr:hypothetical protein BJ322DRAFT_1102259 [Thelephora terrestris]